MESNIKLYRQIPGLPSPWKVVHVRLDVEGQNIHLDLGHDLESKFKCSKFSSEYGCNDHSPEQTWRHLNTCQFHCDGHVGDLNADHA
jgi:hypothetical protein